MSDRDQIRRLMRLGSEYLLSGDPNKAIEQFDQAHRLQPSIDPWLWQRGLAYYFADKFEEGANQFERDMAVNAQDTEESVWRFLCQARGRNLDYARSNLILPAEGDSRVPMFQALRLFQGSGDEDEVLNAVQKQPEGSKRRKAEFYGYYYIGLFHEACGDFAKAMEWIQKANEVELQDDYMADLARMHAKLRLKK